MKYISRRAVAAWLVAGVGLLAWSGLSAGLEAGSHARYEDELAVAQERAHFWRVVAGQEQPGRGQSEKLAKDLRLALQKGTQDDEEIANFRGTATQYGGITEEMGFDPFAGENCDECGPLKHDFAEDVLRVADGDVSQVIAEEQPEEPDEALSMPGWMWWVWLAYGCVLIGASAARLRAREEQQWKDYPEERRLIDDLDRACAELPPGEERANLHRTKLALLNQIDERRKYGQTEVRRMAHERLLREATTTLTDFAEGNKALTKEKT